MVGQTVNQAAIFPTVYRFLDLQKSFHPKSIRSQMAANLPPSTFPHTI